MRLDIFLAQHSDLSRSQLQKHIKGGNIIVNDAAVSPHYKIHPGDVVLLKDLTVAFREQQESNSSKLEPAVLFEDDNYLVVDKPSGLIVHGGPGIHESTLADWAVAHDSKIAEVGDNPEERPGIVHRLDKDVSGVMVIAKTQKAFDDLKGQFQNHTVLKEYIALAYGRITDQAGRITFAIARSESKSGLMAARPNSKEGKTAETRFTVERFVKLMTLVKVRTLTGRSHQIRVHMKAIGHPLVGDPLYKIKRQRPTKIPAPRLFLHAARLGFTALNGDQIERSSPLPSDLAQFLARIS